MNNFLVPSPLKKILISINLSIYKFINSLMCRFGRCAFLCRLENACDCTALYKCYIYFYVCLKAVHWNFQIYASVLLFCKNI